MKLLSKKEADKQKRDDFYKLKIRRICIHFALGLQDRHGNFGYVNKGKTRAEREAYTCGWNWK